MKTAAEMRSFSEKYTRVKNFLLGVKLDKCAFEEVESALKPDKGGSNPALVLSMPIGYTPKIKRTIHQQYRPLLFYIAL